MDIPIGSALGAYRVQAQIGQGGMGVVYQAVHLAQGHTVALKVLASHLSHDPQFVKRFWDEYQTVHSLYHRNIVRVYEFGEDQGRYFIAAEYIAGYPLEQRLAGGRALSLPETVNIVQQVAAALDAAHPRGIVHRDLKPSNILIERGGRVVLTDFGIASIGGGHTGQAQQSNLWWGTPEYMAPEQARGDAHVTHRADIYALGVVAYRMLSGQVPFRRDVPLATLHAHIHETPPPLRTVPDSRPIPARVERVVMQALEKAPARRPLTAGAFARQMAKAAGIRMPGIPSHRQRVHQPAPKDAPRRMDQPRESAPPRSPSVPLPVIGGVVLVSLTLLIIALTNLHQPQSAPRTPIGAGAMAYVCQQGQETHICLQDDAGHQQVFSFGTHDWTPAWSPDGQHIAFASDREGGTHIWILEPRNGTAHPLTTDVQAAASSPSWSPDGRRIAFDADDEGNYDIYTQSISSPAPTRLTSNPAHDSDPAWSPDGLHIAFVSDREDNDLEIYVMDAYGHHVTRLTDHVGRDFGPVWSPDGERIAYECADDAEGDIEICVMDADGHNNQILTRNEVDDRQPAWSPDGRQIAFCRERPGDSIWDVWVMEADGTGQRARVRDGYSNTHPVWKP